MSDQGKAQAADRAERLEKGTTLSGGFVVEDIIGQGGMAIVYRGIQKSLNRPVALKVLHSRFAKDAQFIERFEGEAGALASLSHPNIVNIIDRGNDDGHYFFVMELVEGKTLDQLIIMGGLNRSDWKRMVVACREALEYVHKRGVVHRDIKPSNILVNDEGAIKIGDFGIAHIVHGSEEALAKAAEAAPRAVGTANYMAPEQTTEPGGVDQRADVFSLAVTFYKMMTRTLPVGNFPMPSEANPDVPSTVDPVLVKAMAHDRNERYATVGEFCDDLMKALKDQGTSITSILGTRRAGMVSVGSLYTGDDFRKGPQPGKEGRSRTPERTPRPQRGKHTPPPQSGSFSTSDMLRSLTPLPLDSAESKPAAASKPAKGAGEKSRSTPPAKKDARTPAAKSSSSKSRKGAKQSGGGVVVAVALAVGLLGVLLLGGVLMIVLNGSDANGDSAFEELTPAGRISEERERMFEELAREREEEMARERDDFAINGNAVPETPADVD